MGILNIISLGMKILSGLVQMAERRSLMDAGEAKNIRDSLKELEGLVAKARAARRTVKHDSASIVRDEQNRDR